MISVVIIDFMSAKRTYQYINDYIGCVVEESSFVIVDNSENEENFSCLCQLFGAIDTQAEEIQVIYQGHQVLLLRAPGNIGFAKGNNLGSKKAIDFFDPEYILFSNNDILFPSGFEMKPLIEALREKKDVAIVGPKILGSNGRQQSPNRYVPLEERYLYHQILWPLDSKIPFLHKYVNIMHDEMVDAPTGYVYKVLGAFFLVERKKFEKIGMFDPHTFLYAEEEILSERAKRAGYKVYYLSEITILHEQGATTGNINDSIQKEIRISNWLIDSEMYYYTTYCGYTALVEKICRLVNTFYLWKRRWFAKIKKGQE